jgi:DNA-binding response OmpR family regulator
VHRLRKRFCSLGVAIRTVRGFGYVLEACEGMPADGIAHET